MQSTKATKKDFINSISALDIDKVSQEHIKFITFVLFKKEVNCAKCDQNKQILNNLCVLYGLSNLYKDCIACFDSGFFNEGTSKNILEAIKTVNKLIRPRALGIIEMLGFKEMHHLSAIGNSYGDIYETHLEWARESRLNQGEDAIPEGFMEYMMPILKGKL